MAVSFHNKEMRNVLSFDYALKRLLRQKVNYDILEGFLSELLGRPVKVHGPLESETQQDNALDKQTRVDILAEDTNGELMIIEVQYQYEIDYLQRILYGASKHMVNHIHKGNPYGAIKKVYSISIIYFPNFHNDNEYIYHGKTDFKGMHTGTILHLTKDQQNVFGKVEVGDLYPEYYLLDVTNFNDVATNTLDEWIYYFKNNKVEDSFTAQGIRRVREVLQYDSLSLAEQKVYDWEREMVRSWDNAIYSARLSGKVEGVEVGEAERAQLQQDLAAEKEKSAAALAAEKEKAAAQAARIAELEKLLSRK